jgi:hypothetical protein
MYAQVSALQDGLAWQEQYVLSIGTNKFWVFISIKFWAAITRSSGGMRVAGFVVAMWLCTGSKRTGFRRRSKYMLVICV